ncbi:hypothetical protein [Rubritalea tangerina]|uniref:hypothetical protein n=1 Tax=Rubritalea tangerina TaxID=430798 RepID=UPI003607E205
MANKFRLGRHNSKWSVVYLHTAPFPHSGQHKNGVRRNIFQTSSRKPFSLLKFLPPLILISTNGQRSI